MQEFSIVMFRNFFNKQTPHQISNNKQSNSLLTPNKKPATTKNITIPISFLKRLLPVSQLLTEKEIQHLNVTAASFTPGSIVFNRGTEVDSLSYLVKGNIFMEADNGSGVEICANTFKALYPLSAGKLHHFTAIAGSAVTVIYISKDILQPDQRVATPNNVLNISEDIKDNPLLTLFYEHFTKGELRTPHFPDIALKLREAIHKDCGIADIVKIINLDPVISAKLIQVVNSPIYKPVNPISNCLDAVNRLGLTTTRNLVTAFSMRGLAQSKNPLTKKLFQQNWLQSIKVSSISHTLAQLTKRADPDEALLAGLLHNIGVLPILTFADSLPEDAYQQTDIEFCVNEIYGQVGSIILEQWEFPNKLRQIPLQSSNWFTNTSEDLNLNDIVLLARYHNILTSPAKTELPLITTLPAFQKLEKQHLGPHMSLQILHDAQQQIAETMSFFSR
jgi:HD-like signal output (HDOD) protein